MPRQKPRTAAPPRRRINTRFAAIAYEWLFGRPIAHAGRSPGRSAEHAGRRSRRRCRKPLRARSRRTRAIDSRRAPSSASAIASAVVPELPFDSKREGAFLARGQAPAGARCRRRSGRSDRPVHPGVGDRTSRLRSGTPGRSRARQSDVDDIRIVDDEPLSARARLRSDRDDSFRSRTRARSRHHRAAEGRDHCGCDSRPVASWNPSTVTPARDAQKFGGLALILAAIVGAVFGFAAGYMARPRALQSGPPQDDRGRRTPAAPIAVHRVHRVHRVRKCTGATAPSTPAPRHPRHLQAPEAPVQPAARRAVCSCDPRRAGRVCPLMAWRKV